MGLHTTGRQDRKLSKRLLKEARKKVKAQPWFSLLEQIGPFRQIIKGHKKTNELLASKKWSG
ncbi:MAG: hypothetical protein VX860_04930 [Verrucomicrobiota bacterium]|nr:hypothetical protein [Verrucomicrobiota bacterium]